MALQPNAIPIEIADSSADPLLAAYTINHPHASIFHHPGWLRSLELENNQHVIRLIGKNNTGAIVGVLPLIRTRGLPFGIGGIAGSSRISSLPRTPCCGPLADSPEIMENLLIYAIRNICNGDRERFQCKSMHNDLHHPGNDLQQIIWRKTCIKQFPDPATPLTFGNRRNHLRIATSIRKTAALGVCIREMADKEQLVEWYRLYARTMQRHLVPPRSYRFFSALWDNLHPAGYLKLLIAEYSENSRTKIIAGSLFLLFGKSCHYAFNGSDATYNCMRPNDAIQWHFQHFAHARGFRYLDLGEVPSDNSGLKAFKHKWGVEEKEIYHYYAPAIETHPDISGKGTFSRLVLPLWKRMPVEATIIAGKIVNNYL